MRDYPDQLWKKQADVCLSCKAGLQVTHFVAKWTAFHLRGEGYTVRAASEMLQESDEDPSMEQQDVELESKPRSL